MLDTFITDFKRWAARPYKEDGNILDWTLFLGFVAAISILWSRVIARIID